MLNQTQNRQDTKTHVKALIQEIFCFTDLLSQSINRKDKLLTKSRPGYKSLALDMGSFMVQHHVLAIQTISSFFVTSKEVHPDFTTRNVVYQELLR